MTVRERPSVGGSAIFVRGGTRHLDHEVATVRSVGPNSLLDRSARRGAKSSPIAGKSRRHSKPKPSVR